MKITAGQLRQLIREEIELLNEADITKIPYEIDGYTINFHPGKSIVTVKHGKSATNLKLLADFSANPFKGYEPLKINKVVGSKNNIKGMQMDPPLPRLPGVEIKFDNKGFRNNVLPAIKDALATSKGEKRAFRTFGVKAVKA